LTGSDIFSLQRAPTTIPNVIRKFLVASVRLFASFKTSKEFLDYCEYMDKNVCENTEQLKNGDAQLFSFFYILFIQLNAFMLHVLYLQQTKTEDNQLNETKALQNAIRQAKKKRMNLRNKVG